MHQLNIIHFDIKPHNIGFSSILTKPVFLDFGFTKIINENAGEMKRMHFSGTIGYCSEEMVKAYYNQEP